MLGGTFRGPWVACGLCWDRDLVICATLESSDVATAARTLRKPNSQTAEQPDDFGEIIDNQTALRAVGPLIPPAPSPPAKAPGAKGGQASIGVRY
jgi:hypothetical protein